MKLITKIISTCNNKLSRLCRRSYYKNTINNTWTVHTFPKPLKECKCFLSSYKCETNTVNKNENCNLGQISDVHEHKIIHKIFKNSVYYKYTIFPSFKIIPYINIENLTHIYTTNWENESAENILNALKKLSYCQLNGSMLEISSCKPILNRCTEILQTFSNDQILILMKCLIALSNILEGIRNSHKLFKALNKECLKRFYTSQSQELLLISDAFYQLNDGNSNYMWRALRKLSAKPHKLPPKLLVHFLFLTTVSNSKIPLNIFEIECHLINCLDELSIDEIGIVSRSYFLNQKSLQSKKLSFAITQAVINNSKTISAKCLGSVMKLLRYSSTSQDTKQLLQLLQKLREEIPRLQLPCLTSIAHACGGLRIYDEILIQNIIQRLQDTLHESRIKDIERIIFALCALTPMTDYYANSCYNIMKHVMSILTTHEASDIHKYPISLARILTFVTIKNLYIPELLRFVFDPSRIQQIFNSKIMKNEYLIIHCSVKIDFPNYEGSLLSENMYKFLTKKFSHDDEDICRKDRSIQLKCEIMFICKNTLGLNAYVDYILPHYPNREIILGFDNNNNSVDIEPILSAMPMYSIKRVDSAELKTIKWIILLTLHYNQAVYGRNGFIGSVYRKMRHLKTIGYTPIPIYHCIWEQYSDEDKPKQLKSLIYQETSMFPHSVL